MAGWERLLGCLGCQVGHPKGTLAWWPLFTQAFTGGKTGAYEAPRSWPLVGVSAGLVLSAWLWWCEGSTLVRAAEGGPVVNLAIVGFSGSVIGLVVVLGLWRL